MDTTERKIGNTMRKSKEVWKHNTQSSGNKNNRFEKCGNTTCNIKAKFGINDVQLAGTFGKTDVQIERRVWTQNCTSSRKIWTQYVKISREIWKRNVHVKIVCFTVFFVPALTMCPAVTGPSRTSRKTCTFKNL